MWKVVTLRYERNRWGEKKSRAEKRHNFKLPGGEEVLLRNWSTSKTFLGNYLFHTTWRGWPCIHPSAGEWVSQTLGHLFSNINTWGRKVVNCSEKFIEAFHSYDTRVCLYGDKGSLRRPLTCSAGEVFEDLNWHLSSSRYGFLFDLVN